MLQFASITLDLQLQLSKKMSYFDQINIEMASKHGKDIIEFIKNTRYISANVVLGRNYPPSLSTIIYLDTPKGSRLYITKKRLRKILKLPRFKVSSITVGEDLSSALKSTNELCEKVEFTADEVTLYGEGASDFAIFNRLADTFNISKMFIDECPESALFSVPTFCQLKDVTFRIDSLTDDLLLLLHARNITFYEKTSASRIPSTVNLVFKQWFQNRRTIERFKLETDLQDVPLPKEILFSGLPYSIIWQCEERQITSKVILLLNQEKYERDHELRKDDVIYSVDRGDKKLLIFTRINEFILAREYSDPNDAYEISAL